MSNVDGSAGTGRQDRIMGFKIVASRGLARSVVPFLASVIG
jgi:hypothetical protein